MANKYIDVFVAEEDEKVVQDFAFKLFCVRKRMNGLGDGYWNDKLVTNENVEEIALQSRLDQIAYERRGEEPDFHK